MENLIQGYELLDNGLKNYIIKKLFMTYKHLEITASSEDGINTIKLQFDGIEDIVLDKYGADSVISKLNLSKTEDDMLLAKIEDSEDVEMKIISKKLVATRV